MVPLVVQKNPSATVDISVSYVNQLATGETIASATAAVVGAGTITVGAPTVASPLVVVRVSGGTNGITDSFVILATTSTGEILDATIYVVVGIEAPSLLVSTYTDASDLTAYLRTARLGELVNDDGSKSIDGADTINFLNEQLWRTERIVHGYISPAWACPQAEMRSPVTFGMLSELVLTITAYRLFTRGLIAGGAVADLKTAAEAAYKQLQKFQAGTPLPSDAVPGPAATSAQSARFKGGSEAKLYGDPDEDP